MTGSEVCKKIKADQRFAKLPVILFTASVDNLAEVVKEAGADGYMSKPFEQEQLLATITKFIG